MTKIEERVSITDSLDLQRHFESLLPTLSLPETEDSWQKIEKSLNKLEIITKSGGYKHDNFPALFKGVAESIVNSLLSERTKLSGTAADLLNSVAPRLGERFESLVQAFTPTLLLICARTNKVALVRAKKCLLLIAKHCKLPCLFPYLRDASKDKSQTVRIVSIEVTLMLLDSIESKEKIARRIADVELIIRGTATDRDAEARQLCKKLFEVYVDRWPERMTLFTSTFTPTTRRYLALPKSDSTAQLRTTYIKPQAMPITRTISSERAPPRSVALNNRATPGHPVRQVSKLGMSQASSSHSIAPRVQVRVNSNPSSSSSSAKSSKVTAEEETRSNQADSAEEERRTALRAEIIKQATGTPSQSIAARLALEQFDFQLRKEEKQRKMSGSQEYEQTFKSSGPSGGGDFDRAIFTVAMAKKPTPRKVPGKAPGRIIVAPAPTVQRVVLSDSTSRPPQRIASSTTKAKVEEEEDVFKSRPIDKALPTKVASSISKSLGAKEKLLGSPRNATNRTKAGTARGAIVHHKKILALKVDIGKENIPPGSALSKIAEIPRDVSPLSSIPPAAALLSIESETVVQVQQDDEIKAVKDQTSSEVVTKMKDVEILQEQQEPIATTNLDVKVSNASIADRILDQEIAISPPASSEEVDVTAGENLVKQESIVITAKMESSPLQDWTKVTASLQEDVPLSASSDSTYQKTTGPFMSTPLRRPLGALQLNAATSISSPLVSLSQFSKSVNHTKPNSTFQSPSQMIRNDKSFISKAKARVLLVASRKM